VRFYTNSIWSCLPELQRLHTISRIIYSGVRPRFTNNIQQPGELDDAPTQSGTSVYFVLRQGQILNYSDAPPQCVYFLDEGVASLSVSNKEGVELELCIVGNEGTVGERAIFDIDVYIIECTMLTDGHGHKIDAEIFREEFYRGGQLQRIVLNNLEARIVEASQTSLCNQTHSLEQRLARWLLTLADRSGTNELDITHEGIRKALGVTRSPITRAAVELREKGIIDYIHGKVTIIDRHDLEKESCECYGIIEKALDAVRDPPKTPE
jgi:CRP-like cAMP-binding protein